MRNQKSFTLIEIIMTILIMGIVSVALGLFVINQVQAVARSDDYALAFNLARLEIEVVNNLTYASVTTTNASNYDGYNGYDMYRTVTTLYTSGSEGLKQVVVQIRRPGSSENLAALTTYVANNVTFGL